MLGGPSMPQTENSGHGPAWSVRVPWLPYARTAGSIGRLELGLGHRQPQSIRRMADHQRTRVQLRREVGKIVVCQNSRNHPGKLAAANSTLDHVDPRNERPLQDECSIRFRESRAAACNTARPAGPTPMTSKPGRGVDRLQDRSCRAGKAGRRPAGPAGAGRYAARGRLPWRHCRLRYRCGRAWWGSGSLPYPAGRPGPRAGRLRRLAAGPPSASSLARSASHLDNDRSCATGESGTSSTAATASPARIRSRAREYDSHDAPSR